MREISKITGANRKTIASYFKLMQPLLGEDPIFLFDDSDIAKPLSKPMFGGTTTSVYTHR